MIPRDLILLLENYAENLKPKLYSDQFAGLENVRSFCYFVSNLFTFRTYDDAERTLIPLADICTEFRFLPNPYGEIANELCEILENESYFPTITKLKRLMEDFPKIIEFDRKSENKSLAMNQSVLVYEK